MITGSISKTVPNQRDMFKRSLFYGLRIRTRQGHENYDYVVKEAVSSKTETRTDRD